MAEKSRQIRQLPHRGHRINASKAQSRLQTGVTRLLGLPYVVEMRRKILAVLKQFITSHHKYISSQLFEE